MGMDCEEAASAAKRIAAGKETDSALMDEFLGHSEACSACASRYAALIPFLRRDAGGSFFSAPEPSAESAVDAVMARLPSRRATPPRRAFAAVPAAAAFAAAALALFILLGRSASGDSVEVRFTLYAPHASSVVLAADFNAWAEKGYEMKRSAEPGVWEIQVPLKRGKSYLYNFVVDGEKWIPDPRASVILDDGFGNKSSSISI